MFNSMSILEIIHDTDWKVISTILHQNQSISHQFTYNHNKNNINRCKINGKGAIIMAYLLSNFILKKYNFHHRLAQVDIFLHLHVRFRDAVKNDIWFTPNFCTWCDVTEWNENATWKFMLKKWNLMQFQPFLLF